MAYSIGRHSAIEDGADSLAGPNKLPIARPVKKPACVAMIKPQSVSAWAIGGIGISANKNAKLAIIIYPRRGVEHGGAAIVPACGVCHLLVIKF